MLARCGQILGIVLCLSCGGCVRGVGGGASVDAFSVADAYSRIKQVDGREVFQEPTADQLTPIKSVVVVTYYETSGKMEFLEAKRVDAKDGRVNYPLRLYAFVPFVILGVDVGEIGPRIDPGAVVFSDGCWPTDSPEASCNVPSVFSASHDSTYPPPFGCAYRLHAVLYRRTRPAEFSVGLALFEGPEGLIKAVEQATNLSRKDRQMVYSQMLAVLEKEEEMSMATRTLEGRGDEAKTDYGPARRLFKEKLDALGQPR